MRARLIILAAFLAALAAPLPASAQERLVLSVPRDPAADICLHVLDEAYSRLGIVVEARRLPAARALEESSSGRTHGEVGRIRELEHQFEDLVRVPVAVNRIEAVAFMRDRGLGITGWESLSGLHVGIRLGTRFAEIATRMFPLVTSKNENHELFDLLARDRLDVIVTSRIEGERILQQMPDSGIHAAPVALESHFLFHYLHRSRADLLPRITHVLLQMQAAGEIERLRRRFAPDHGH